jgi:hypothetical protein
MTTLRGFKRSFAILLAGTSAAFGAAALAQDQQNVYFVRGSGALPCAEVIATVEGNGPGLVALVAWADGALSTVNRMRPDTFDILPFTEPPGLVTQLAVNVCRQRPQMTFDMALVEVFAALESIRIVEQADPVRMVAGRAEVRLRAETLRRVQERLIALGHLQGSADGAYGPATGAALRKFQGTAKLPASGLPDVETVLRLLLGE